MALWQAKRECQGDGAKLTKAAIQQLQQQQQAAALSV